MQTPSLTCMNLGNPSRLPWGGGRSGEAGATPSAESAFPGLPDRSCASGLLVSVRSHRFREGCSRHGTWVVAPKDSKQVAQRRAAWFVPGRLHVGRFGSRARVSPLALPRRPPSFTCAVAGDAELREDGPESCPQDSIPTPSRVTPIPRWPSGQRTTRFSPGQGFPDSPHRWVQLGALARPRGLGTALDGFPAHFSVETGC